MRSVAPSQERELKQYNHIVGTARAVAPSQERELKRNPRFRPKFRRVAPSQERELKRENHHSRRIAVGRSLTGA